MKRIIALFAFVSLCPYWVFAQELEETIYVVSQVNRTELPLESCNWALPLLGGQPLISAARSHLNKQVELEGKERKKAFKKLLKEFKRTPLYKEVKKLSKK